MQHVLDADNDGVITEAELQSALGFLREQLGEDELRALLQRLNVLKTAAAGDGAAADGGAAIDVCRLRELAQPEVGKAGGVKVVVGGGGAGAA